MHAKEAEHVAISLHHRPTHNPKRTCRATNSLLCSVAMQAAGAVWSLRGCWRQRQLRAAHLQLQQQQGACSQVRTLLQEPGSGLLPKLARGLTWPRST